MSNGVWEWELFHLYIVLISMESWLTIIRINELCLCLSRKERLYILYMYIWKYLISELSSNGPVDENSLNILWIVGTLIARLALFWEEEPQCQILHACFDICVIYSPWSTQKKELSNYVFSLTKKSQTQELIPLQPNQNLFLIYINNYSSSSSSSLLVLLLLFWLLFEREPRTIIN